MPFKYISPLKRGYEEVRLTQEEHNKALNNVGKRSLFSAYKYSYYVNNNNEFLIERYYNNKVIIISTILLPVLFLLSIISIKKTFNEYLSLFNQRKKGNYYTTTMLRNRVEVKIKRNLIK